MFKSYTSYDNLLLPPCLVDFIPQTAPVRVVLRIIEQINHDELARLPNFLYLRESSKISQR